MQIIENKKGFKIQIRNLYQCSTYEGMMLGSLEDANEIILASPYNRYLPTMWDKWPFIELKITQYKNQKNLELPKVATCAFITADTGTDKSPNKNSSIVAFWFQDDYFQAPPDEIIEEIRNIDWIKKAKNWEW